MARDVFALIGRLRTEGFDTLQKSLGKMDKGLAKATNKLNKFGKDVQKIGVNITKLTAPFAGAIAGIGILAVKTGEYADKLLDLEQVTGLTTDSLQEYENVARVAGVSFDGFVNSIAKFQARIPQIIEENGVAADAISSLGVEVFDASGDIRDMNSLFPEMINRLQSMENVTERNALAQQIFGRSMADVAPVLGLTADEMAAAQKEAHDLGLVMSKEALDAANKFRIQIDKLKGQFAATGRELASKFIPILQDTVVPLITGVVVPAIQKAVDVIGKLADWFKDLSPFLQDTILGFVTFAVTIGPVLIAIGKVISAVKLLSTIFTVFNAILAANPIGIVVVAIGLLVTAGIILVKNWEQVKETFINVWESMLFGVKQAVSFMTALILDWMVKTVEAIQTVGRFIPGLNAKLESARGKLVELRDAEQQLSFERKLAREEAKLLAIETAKLTVAVEEETKAEDKSSVSTLRNTKIKEDAAKATEKQRKAAEKLAADRAKFEEDFTKKLQGATLTRVQLLDIEKNESLAIANELGAERLSIEQFYKIERLKLVAEEKKAIIDASEAARLKRIEDTQKVAAFIGETTATLFDLFSQDTDNKLLLLDQETEAKRLSIENSIASEAEKNVAFAKLEEEADAKKKALLTKQAKRDKAAAIFSAVLSGFQSVAKALTLGFPLGIIAAVIMGALSIAQIALIAARPLPQLREGGLAKAVPGGTDVTVAEGGQDELIMPLETGVKSIVNGILKGLAGVVLPPALPAALAGGSGGGAIAASAGGDTILQIGTLIADDSSLRSLERLLNRFRIQDQQRKGLA